MGLDASKIKVGPGHLYIDVTKPANGVALALGAGGVPTSGTELGLTSGESLFTYDVKYFEVMADQSLSPVGTFAQEEHAKLEFSMLEFDHFNVLAYMQQATSGANGLVTFGSDDITVCPRSIVLVSEIPNCVAQTLYTIVMLYAAYQSAPATMRFTRQGETLMKSAWIGLALPTRSDGDTLGQLVIQQAGT